MNLFLYLARAFYYFWDVQIQSYVTTIIAQAWWVMVVSSAVWQWSSILQVTFYSSVPYDDFTFMQFLPLYQLASPSLHSTILMP